MKIKAIAILCGLVMSAGIAGAQDGRMELGQSEVTVVGDVRVERQAATSSEHDGVSSACLSFTLGSDRIKMCEPDGASASEYICHAVEATDGVGGSCECVGPCQALASLCNDLGGEIVTDATGGMCSF